MEPVSRSAGRANSLRRLAGVALGALGVFFLLIIALDLGATVWQMRGHFNCDYFDGCFQLFNPLRRLAAGQLLGRDFNFFYGGGVLLLHWPLYFLLGHNLFAAQASLLLTSPVCLLAMTWLFGYMFFRRWDRAFFFTASLAAVSGLLFPELLHVESAPLGVKMLGPLLVMTASLASSGFPGGRRKTWWLGVAAGLALYISPDYGLATVAAGFLAAILFCPGPGKFWKGAPIFVAVSLLTAGAASLLVSGRWAWSYWHFHLIAQPGDQMWYFGVPPSNFLASWGDLLADPRYVAFLVFVAVAVAALWRVRRQLAATEGFAVTFAVIFSVIAVLPVFGRAVPYYFAASYWLLAMAGVILAARLPLGPPTRKFAAVSLLGTAVIFIVATGISQGSNALERAFMARPLTTGSFSGVNLSTNWQDLRREFRRLTKADERQTGDQKALWSTYASVLEADLGIFNPATDYLIHALGPEGRAAYVASFRSVQPRLVRTATHNFFFEPMFWNSDWDFYERLVDNYDWASEVANGAFWRRRPGSWVEPAGWDGEAAVIGGQKIVLPDLPPQTLVTVEVNYRLSNPWRWLPILGQTPRVFLRGEGLANRVPISMPPYPAGQWRSLVLSGRQGGPGGLRLDVVSLLPGVRATITAARYRLVRTTPADVEFFYTRRPGGPTAAR